MALDVALEAFWMDFAGFMADSKTLVSPFANAGILSQNDSLTMDDVIRSRNKGECNVGKEGVGGGKAFRRHVGGRLSQF